MNKIFAIFILLISSNFAVFAQEPTEMKWNISIGYGVGNIWTKFLKNAFDVPEYKVTALGPISIIGEYQIYKNLSAGISFTYSDLNGYFNKNGFVFSDELLIYTGLARANYHPIINRKWDIYLGGGLGYVNSQYKSSLGTGSSNVPGEFGYSAQIGAHYYLTKKAGFYGELGYVNGSFLQLGVCLQL